MMIRLIYCWMLQLHPERFRREFAEEMLWIFDQPAIRQRKVRLLGDAVISLVRQWTLRGGAWDTGIAPELSDAAAQRFPMFQTVEPLHLWWDVLMKGGALTIVNFLMVGLAVTAGTKSRPDAGTIALPSSSATAPAVLSRDGVSALDPGDKPEQLDSSIQRVERELRGARSVGAPGLREGAASKGAATAPLPDTSSRFEAGTIGTGLDLPSLSPRQRADYFSALSVLEALDANDDFEISLSEIRFAESYLRVLDRNRDGRLDAHECGLRVGAPGAELDPEYAGAAGAFTSLHPVHRVVDRDGDAILSSQELREAPGKLSALDTNGDGLVKAEELWPGSTLGRKNGEAAPWSRLRFSSRRNLRRAYFLP